MICTYTKILNAESSVEMMFRHFLNENNQYIYVIQMINERAHGVTEDNRLGFHFRVVLKLAKTNIFEQGFERIERFWVLLEQTKRENKNNHEIKMRVYQFGIITKTFRAVNVLP